MLFIDKPTEWEYLGSATGATTTVGPVTWTKDYKRLFFEYVITGYNGGTPVGRVLIGNSSITTTGLTNGNSLRSGTTVDNTSVSKPGLPLAVTLSNIARAGQGFVWGASGSLKNMSVYGQNGNPAVGTAPTEFQGNSFFSDLGTNLLIHRMQLTVYDTLTATSVSAQTFSSGTYIAVYGINE
jgi:hypothetical protein